MITDEQGPPPKDEIENARRRFDAACEHLRPDLHRFCTRMTGSPCDGEDVLQDALVLAFHRLGDLREAGSLRAWLFRIAHNKCIDFLRGRRAFTGLDAEMGHEEERTMDERVDDGARVRRAFTGIVTELGPRERACVVLKDVIECSLEETAEITGSNVGAVKAAIHRGREKLAEAERGPPQQVSAIPDAHRALVVQYLAAFNRRDWDGVRALLSDEARLEVVHRTEGAFKDAGYLANYARLQWNWRLSLAWVDGVETIVHFREIEGTWAPHAVVELEVDEAESGKIVRVRDYVHVAYLLRPCEVREGT